MNIPLVIANLLCLLAFGAHTFIGDKEMRSLEPEEAEEVVTGLEALEADLAEPETEETSEDTGEGE